MLDKDMDKRQWLYIACKMKKLPLLECETCEGTGFCNDPDRNLFVCTECEGAGKKKGKHLSKQLRGIWDKMWIDEQSDVVKFLGDEGKRKPYKEFFKNYIQKYEVNNEKD